MRAHYLHNVVPTIPCIYSLLTVLFWKQIRQKYDIPTVDGTGTSTVANEENEHVLKVSWVSVQYLPSVHLDLLPSFLMTSSFTATLALDVGISLTTNVQQMTEGNGKRRSVTLSRTPCIPHKDETTSFDIEQSEITILQNAMLPLGM